MSTDKEKKSKFAAAAIKAIGVEGWGKLQKLWKFEEEAAAATEAILADGTKIVYDRLEEGGKVMVVTEEGELPVADADHTLADGTVISTVGGLIVKIVAGEVTPPAEQTMSDDVSKMMDDKINALYEKLKAELTPKEEEKKPEEMAAEEEKKEEEKKEGEEMKAEFAKVKTELEELRQSFGKAVQIIEDMIDPLPETKTKEDAKAQTFGKAEKASRRAAVQAELNKYSTAK